MKRRIHQCLLIVVFLPLILAAFVGMLLAVALAALSYEQGFHPRAALAFAVFLLPTALCWQGCRLFFRLYAGYLPRVRRGLLWQYTGVAIAYAALLLEPVERNGQQYFLLSSYQGLLILGILLIAPVLTVLLMRPETLSAVERGATGSGRGVAGNLVQSHLA